MKIVATVEARMTSSRLPGKVLLPALQQPMLHHLVARLRAAPSIDEIVLATTVNAADESLVAFGLSEDIRVFRGSEADVMGRVIGAAALCAADLIVEITGDCPIIDPEIVEQVIRMYLKNDADYVGNSHVRSYPDGMDTQVFRLATLQRSAALTADPLDREHVSLHMRRNPQLFRHINVVAPPALHWPELGLTLDEEADYQLLRRIIETLAPRDPTFGCRAAIELLRANPQWVDINRGVTRKGDS